MMFKPDGIALYPFMDCGIPVLPGQFDPFGKAFEADLVASRSSAQTVKKDDRDFEQVGQQCGRCGKPGGFAEKVA